MIGFGCSSGGVEMVGFWMDFEGRVGRIYRWIRFKMRLRGF